MAIVRHESWTAPNDIQALARTNFCPELIPCHLYFFVRARQAKLTPFASMQIFSSLLLRPGSE
jgi:hypothetical protein